MRRRDGEVRWERHTGTDHNIQHAQFPSISSKSYVRISRCFSIGSLQRRNQPFDRLYEFGPRDFRLFCQIGIVWVRLEESIERGDERAIDLIADQANEGAGNWY